VSEYEPTVDPMLRESDVEPRELESFSFAEVLKQLPIPESRRCLDCGAVNLKVAPNDASCRWCGGRLESSKEAWL
jgi:hypothetical protein